MPRLLERIAPAMTPLTEDAPSGTYPAELPLILTGVTTPDPVPAIPDGDWDAALQLMVLPDGEPLCLTAISRTARTTSSTGINVPDED